MPSQNNLDEKDQFPYEISDVDSELNEELLQYFQGERTGFVQVGPKKYFFPAKYRDAANKFYNFESRSDDIWVCTFPRSGTTLMLEIVWLIVNNLDYDTAHNRPLNDRCPFFEFFICLHDQLKREILKENSDSHEKCDFIEEIAKPGYELLAKRTGPRIIKTHFAFSLLPRSVMTNKLKVIYIARNPKDVIVSFYHLNKLYRTQGYVGDLKRYWNYFRQEKHLFLPYWSHLEEGWSHRNHDNVLFLFYEDIIKDMTGTIKRVAKFLGKSLSNEQITQLTDHMNIDNFRNNDAVNARELKDARILNFDAPGFVRNGRTNGGEHELTNEILEEIENWTQENLAKMEFRFPE